MQGLRAFIGPTGGLGYHFTAWRFKAGWRPFKERVTAWLTAWNPPEKQLILFGPSAGYTLSPEFLARFDVVRIVEPDPLARRLFARRFRELNSRFKFDSAYDILPWWNDTASDPSAKLATYLADCEADAGPCAVLFSNFLGQIPLLKHDTDREDLRASFFRGLGLRNWASYHDLFSGKHSDFNRCPDSITPPATAAAGTGAPGRASDGDGAEELARQFFKTSAEVIDHGSLWLSRGRVTPVCRWDLTSKDTHVIGFVTARK